MHDDERIVELETRIMYQERTIAELGELVAGHESRVARLEDALRKLAERMKDLSEDKSGGAMPHVKPPHY